MSVPINAWPWRNFRKAPRYVKRANKRAKQKGFESAIHMFLFHQILANRIAERKAKENA
jgi:hypothetical protein